jgi:hypothetical protein
MNFMEDSDKNIRERTPRYIFGYPKFGRLLDVEMKRS